MAKKYEIRREFTPRGFNYGAAEIEGMFAHDSGAVTILVTTPKGTAQVYVTRTGKIRLWLGRDEAKPERAWQVDDEPVRSLDDVMADCAGIHGTTTGGK